MRTVISYDISSDKRRRKVAKILEGYGYRVQYSVFECDLTVKKLAEVKRRLKPLVNAKEWESVRFYPLVADSVERAEVLGKDLRQELGSMVIV